MKQEEKSSVQTLIGSNSLLNFVSCDRYKKKILWLKLFLEKRKNIDSLRNKNLTLSLNLKNNNHNLKSYEILKSRRFLNS